MGTTNGHSSTPKKEVQVERELAVKLTEKELLERGDRMADCELEIEGLKVERSRISRAINEQVTKRAELAHTIDTGDEKRVVLCKWVKNFTQNCWQLIRQDTLAEVDNRPLTAADRQSSIAFPEDDAVPPAEVVEVGSQKVDFGSVKKSKPTKLKVAKAPKLAAAKPSKPKSSYPSKKSGRSSRHVNA